MKYSNQNLETFTMVFRFNHKEKREKLLQDMKSKFYTHFEIYQKRFGNHVKRFWSLDIAFRLR